MRSSIPTATVATVAGEFRIDGRLVSWTRYGNGHINETYLAIYRNGEREMRYIHQRVNERVFPDVACLTENVARVTRHLRAKLAGVHGAELSRRVLTPVPSAAGEGVVRVADGSWWRTFEFVGAARTYEVAGTPERAYRAARAFGAFIRALGDLGGAPLHETIPDFHDTPARLAQLTQAIAADPCARAAAAGEEIAFCLKREALTGALQALRRSGIARTCVTHNDTKLNNVLFDEASDEAICVVDLDTVMPGIALYDFGDLVRTTVLPVREDERDLRGAEMDVAAFEAVARGFVEGAGSLLCAQEIESMAVAASVMALECGMRFLADHLRGDTYFRIERPGQNLDRARTQFALVRSLERHEPELRRGLRDLSAKGA